MATSDIREVQKQMGAIANDQPTERELVFDPTSGKLLVSERGKPPSPDAIPATQIARDGFFLGG